MAKVYVSSTIADLESERHAVMDWLVARGHQPVHSYRPNSETVRESCLDDVDTCDLYVLILGHRYGFQPQEGNPEQLSITHLEFRRARESEIPRLALLRTSVPDIRLSDLEDPKRAPLVLAFREEVKDDVRPGEFSDPGGLLQGLSTGIESELDKLRASAEPKRGDVSRYIRAAAHELQAAAGFEGREEIFAQLERFAEARSRGYFRVTAASGLGKTALAAAVSRRYAAPAFFADASGGRTRPDQCLNHFSADLITRFHLPYQDLPSRAGEDSSFFEKMLEEAAKKAGQPLWLVVDGLDAADEAVGGRNTLLLPRHLPAGVYFFLTQRPGDYPLQTDWETPVEDVEIRSDSPMQKRDVARFLASELSRPGMEAVLRRLTPPLDPASFAARLQEDSEGNFTYLRYRLADLAAGESTFAQEGSSGLPKGLNEYYGARWSHMESLATREQKPLYRRIIGLLAVAREPVSQRWLSEVSGYDAALVSDCVQLTWRRFLNCERTGDTERWRLDRSFGDFLARKLDLKASHAAVAAHFRQAVSWLLHGGYPSRYLTTHLRLTGDLPGIMDMVNDHAWHESQMTVDRTGAAYENDLLQAGALAADLDHKETLAGRPARWLAEEVSCALSARTLKSLWANLGSTVLLMLLKAGVLSDVQTLALASKNPSPAGLDLALTNLAPALSDALVHDAVKMTHDVQAHGAMLVLAERLHGAERDALLEEALACARNMRDDDASKVGKLRDVSQRLNDPRRTEVWEEAVRLAKSYADPYDRASALAELANDGAEALGLAEDALDAANSIEDPEYKAEQITGIVSLLPEERRGEASQAALAAAQAVPEPITKSMALAALLAEASGGEREVVFQAARSAARDLTDPAEKAEQLLALAEQADPDARAALLEEAERAVWQIPSRPSQAFHLSQLAELLPGEAAAARNEEAVRLLEETGSPAERISGFLSLAAQSSGEAQQAVLAKALGIAENLPEPLPKARAMLGIARALPDDRMRPLVRKAASIPGGILAAGEPVNNVEFVELLGGLAQRLDPADRKAAVDEAQRLALTIEDSYSRARALASLVPSLGAASRPIVDTIVSIAQSLNRPDQRAELLTAMIPHLSRQEQAAILADAAEAARSVRPGEMYVTGHINMETGIVQIDPFPSVRGNTPLALLGVALAAGSHPREELLGEAVESLYELPAAVQEEVLLHLAPHLPRTTARQITAAYRLLLHDPVRQELLRSLTGQMEPEQEPEDTETTADELQVQFEIRGFDPFKLTRDLDLSNCAVFTTPLRLAGEDEEPSLKAEQERSLKVSILRYFVRQLPEEKRQAISEGARKLRSESGWHRAMAVVLDRLASVESPEVAIAEARSIWPDGWPPVVVGTLAKHLPAAEFRPVIEAALAAAGVLSEPQERIIAFGALLPNLVEPARSVALNDMGRAADELAGKWSFGDLAPCLLMLPPPKLLQVVQRVLRSAEDQQDLLTALREMLPAMMLLSGPEVARSITAAVLQVLRWWS